MTERVVARKVGPTRFDWRVFVDGQQRSPDGTGMNRAEANRQVRTIREKIKDA